MYISLFLGLSKDTQNVSVVVFDAEEGTCLTMNSTITPDASGFAVLPVTEVGCLMDYIYVL